MPLPERAHIYYGEAVRAVGELLSDEELLSTHSGLGNELRILEASIADRDGYTAPFPEDIENVNLKDWYMDIALKALGATVASKETMERGVNG